MDQRGFASQPGFEQHGRKSRVSRVPGVLFECKSVRKASWTVRWHDKAEPLPQTSLQMDSECTSVIRVKFGSHTEAVDGGRKPCKTCRA